MQNAQEGNSTQPGEAGGGGGRVTNKEPEETQGMKEEKASNGNKTQEPLDQKVFCH